MFIFFIIITYDLAYDSIFVFSRFDPIKYFNPIRSKPKPNGESNEMYVK